MSVKLLRIKFDEVFRVIKIHDGNLQLELFGTWFYNVIFDRANYLVSEKSDAKHIINHNFAKIRIDLYDPLPLGRILTFHVIIFIKSVANKNKNNHYFKTFLEKGSHEDKTNT